MEFLGMIAVGVLGLAACGRVFVFLFRLMGLGFDRLEESIGTKRRRYDD